MSVTVVEDTLMAGAILKFLRLAGCYYLKGLADVRIDIMEVTLVKIPTDQWGLRGLLTWVGFIPNGIHWVEFHQITP